tara:strand:- start:34741 stop:35091 length:351 start_codon:yes stop_codon:yes gene_type:complete
MSKTLKSLFIKSGTAFVVGITFLPAFVSSLLLYSYTLQGFEFVGLRDSISVIGAGYTVTQEDVEMMIQLSELLSAIAYLGLTFGVVAAVVVGSVDWFSPAIDKFLRELASKHRVNK